METLFAVLFSKKIAIGHILFFFQVDPKNLCQNNVHCEKEQFERSQHKNCKKKGVKTNKTVGSK